MTDPFHDRSHPPTEADLAALLGKSLARWKDLRQRLARFDPLDDGWYWAGKQAGWVLRPRRRDRTILYMSPRPGHFLASFALGEKAVQAAREAALPAPILALIDAAKKYVEGRAVRIEVRTAKDVRHVDQLATIKMDN